MDDHAIGVDQFESENLLLAEGLESVVASKTQKARRSFRRSLTFWFFRIAILVLAFVGWQEAADAKVLSPVIIGSATGTLEALVNGLVVKGTFWSPLGNTMEATVISFVLGSAIGISGGLIFTMVPIIEELVDPALVAFNAMPRVALAPLFVIWFGLGMTAKVGLGFSLTVFVVLSSTMAGVRGVDRDLGTLAKSLGATTFQMFRELTLPSSVPVLFSGLRLGLIYALLGVITQEIVASKEGVGQLLSLFSDTFQTNGVYAILIILGVIGALLSAIMTKVEAYLLRWK